MGQKVNPKAFRLGITRTWNSKWFSSKNYKEFLREDVMIRKIIKNKLKNSGIAEIEIERSGENIKVIVYVSKPGLIIGRGGAGIEQLRQEIDKKVFGKIYKRKPRGKYNLDISIQEVKSPDLSSQVVTERVIDDIEKRIPFRRVCKQSIENVRKAGAKGVKILVAGRLGGVEIARTEKFTWGNIPLHTLRADIDYSRGAAHTIYGLIGVKVWIYKGEVFKSKAKEETSDEKAKEGAK
ncbi:30S ribosomal protein S3 [Candidatus Falkowbacteria bacterium]|nr:30S ribosomal protein S3 [Candidatus Falkowbacteria bacterium]